jgi:hypothetical protein
VCVLDTIYGLVTKKIAVGNLRKIIVTPKEDNLFLYITSVDIEMCCPKGKCGCQYYILLT